MLMLEVLLFFIVAFTIIDIIIGLMDGSLRREREVSRRLNQMRLAPLLEAGRHRKERYLKWKAAVRQSGSQAVRQSGSQAVRQVRSAC